MVLVFDAGVVAVCHFMVRCNMEGNLPRVRVAWFVWVLCLTCGEAVVVAMVSTFAENWEKCGVKL